MRIKLGRTYGYIGPRVSWKANRYKCTKIERDTASFFIDGHIRHFWIDGSKYRGLKSHWVEIKQTKKKMVNWK